MADQHRAPPPARVLSGIALVASFTSLLMAAEISGRVVDLESGNPLAGALIEVHPGNRLVECHPDGWFRIEALPPGPYRITVRFRGYRDEVVEVDLGPEGKELRIGLVTLLVEEVTVRAAAEPTLTVARLQGDEVRDTGHPDMGRILRGVPGVAAVRRGALGLDPVVRGLREDQVATFVDGGRSFPACPGRMDSGVGHVDPEAVEHVEVVKGPYALSWGAGTVSAVSVVRQRPDRFNDRHWAGRVRAGGESNTEARDGCISLQTGTPRSGYLLSLTARSGNDFEAGSRVEVPGDFESDDLRFVAEWDVRRDGTLSAEIGYLDQGQVDYPGRPMNERSLDARDYRLGYGRRTTGDGYNGYRVEVGASRVDHAMNNDGKPDAGQVDSRADTEVNTSTGRLVFDWGRSGRWQLTAGLDGYDLNQDGRRLIHRVSDGALLFDDAIWADARITDVGAFVRQTLFSGCDQDWTWSARVDAVRARSDEPSPGFSIYTDGDLRQEEVNLSAALQWENRIGDRWAMTAGLGRVVRPANATERYSNWFPSTRFQVSAEFLGGPDLDPEISHQIDYGVRMTSSRVAWSLETFYRIIDDYITVVPDPSIPKVHPGGLPVVYRYVNGDRASYVGFEAMVETRIAAGWQARLQADTVRAEDEMLDEPVFGIPPLRGVASLRYTRPTGRYYLEGRITAVDKQHRVATSRFEEATPGYTLYDLLAGLRLTDGVSLELRGENLTDKFYADHLNSIDPFTGARVPEPGRTVALTAVWQF